MGTNQWDPDSATSNRSVFFRSAQPVWKKGESTALHSRVVFLARLDYAKDASLTITGCNFYRVFLNGEFVGYGPARTSHGYAEVDSYPLNLSASRQNVLEIYALAYGSDNYYAPNEPAFLQAEVVANGTVLSATGKDFLLREWNEKIQKIIRYSFQRGFAEGYDFTRNPAEWEEPEIVEGKNPPSPDGELPHLPRIPRRDERKGTIRIHSPSHRRRPVALFPFLPNFPKPGIRDGRLSIWALLNL